MKSTNHVSREMKSLLFISQENGQITTTHENTLYNPPYTVLLGSSVRFSGSSSNMQKLPRNPYPFSLIQGVRLVRVLISGGTLISIEGGRALNWSK